MTFETGSGRKSSRFRDKVVRSVSLSGLRFLSEILLRLGSTIILTRLLAPEIYGVFAVVLIYLYFLELFSDFGLRSLILTREDEIEDRFLRSCWSVSILRGLLIALMAALIAGVIHYFQTQAAFAPDNPYASTELPWAIVALGGASFVLGFQSPLGFIRERNMEFGRVTAVYIATNILGLIATVLLAFYLRSIWALVLGHATKITLQVVLSFVVFPGPSMRFVLNREDLRVLIGRGKWILGHSALYSLSNAADRLILGFVMTSATFGFYYIARQLVDTIARFLMAVDGQMALQVFTHLQQSTADIFRRNYYRYRLFFDALAGLGTGLGVVLAPIVVGIVFDDRYAEVTPIFQALIWGILLIGPTLLRSAFMAERRFRDMTLLSVVTTLTLIIGLGVTVFILSSVPMALMVVALHRLPEAMILIVMGGDRNWVVIWREFMGFVFCGLGALAGLGGLELWTILR